MILKALLLTRAFLKQYWGAVVILFGLIIMVLEYFKLFDFKSINENLQPWIVYVIGGLIFVIGTFKLYKQKKFWSK